MDDACGKLVKQVRKGRKGGGGKMGGGGKGGKGGAAGGPAWLNRKPWETDLWREFTESPSTSTTDASTTVDTEAPEVAEVVEPVFKARVHKRVGE